MLTIFGIIVLIFSAVIHEVFHGFVADKLGDPTARLSGRLTLNPLKHLDPFGSVILPVLLSLIPGGIIFGWAKPVPYNPYNLKNPEKGAAEIAAAGPLSNLALAFVFGIIFRLTFSYRGGIFYNLNQLSGIVVLVNVVLGIFNLVPIPPLDGAKVLVAAIPDSARRIKRFFYENNSYGWIILIAFIFFGISIIDPVVSLVFRIFTGVSLY